MNRRHYSRRSFALLCALPLIATGCGRSNETPPAAPGGTVAPPVAGAAFKVALVTPGPISDNGWNASAYTALNQIKADLGAETQNVEAKDQGSQVESLRSYASKGFNVVIAHGGEFEAAALQMEKEFPKTLFIIPSGRKIGSNTTPVVINLQDGAYLAGILAAGMSKTGKIASVGATKGVAVEAVFKAFEDGAKAFRPDIVVIPTAYTGDWEDVGKAQQQTMALIGQGADVIIQDLDAAAKGVFQAVDDAVKSGKAVYAIGTNSDQNPISKNILASCPIDIAKAYVPIAKAVKEGTFKPNDTPYGMKSGVVSFVLSPDWSAKLPAPLKTRLDGDTKKILDGTLKASP